MNEVYEKNMKSAKTNSALTKKDYTIKRETCPICYGMGLCERLNGETYDCRNPRCKSGYIEIKIPIKKEK